MSETSFDNVLYEVREDTAWITINRPDKLNALNRVTVGEIAAAYAAADRDAAVRAAVLTGAGDRAFAAGADIAEMAELDATRAREFSVFLHECLERLERGSTPLIAAVNGFALGGGCELAMACHLRVASTNARFGQPLRRETKANAAGGDLLARLGWRPLWRVEPRDGLRRARFEGLLLARRVSGRRCGCLLPRLRRDLQAAVDGFNGTLDEIGLLDDWDAF